MAPVLVKLPVVGLASGMAGGLEVTRTMIKFCRIESHASMLTTDIHN